MQMQLPRTLRPLRHSQWSMACMLGGLLFAVGCSDAGITTPAQSMALDLARSSTDGGVNAGGSLTNGQNHTGTISLAGQADTWTFTATQGDAIFLSVAEVTGSTDFTPWIRLVAPDATTLANRAMPTVAMVEAIAPQTGTYTVLIASADPGHDDTGTYRLILAKAPGAFVVPVGDQGGALTNGANHPGSIPTGDLDMWTFSATQGDEVMLSIAEVAGTPDFTPWLRVIAPNGTILTTRGAPTVSIVDVVAPQTGTYTVLVTTADPENDDTGDYRITLAKAPGAFVVPPGDEGGALANGNSHTGNIPLGDLDLWTFSATQGDEVMLSVAEVTGTVDFTPWLRLVAPNGSIIVSKGGTTVAMFEFVAPQTGTYTVIVTSADQENDDTGTYQIRLAKVPGSFTVPAQDEGGPLTNGANHTGSIPTGDIDMWTFTTGSTLRHQYRRAVGNSRFYAVDSCGSA